MANPTSNFGWQMPQNTDLVKDLPADFEVFGQAVDTSLMDLKGGTTGQVLSKASNTDMDFTWIAQDDSNAIQNAIVDAKGDIITATAADTPARLASSAVNGDVLTVDTSTATGLKWAAPSSGGITLISTTTLSSTNVTLSSIPTTYKDIYLILESFSPQTSNSYLQIRFNNESNTRYQYFGASLGGSTLTNSTSKATQLAIFGTNNQLSGDGENVGLIYIKDYAATTGYKKLVTSQLAAINTSSQDTLSFGFGMYSQFQTAITRIDLFWVGGQSFAGGTAYLYGVK